MGRGRPRLGSEALRERAPPLKQYRARHHTVARLLAAGYTRNQVAGLTGYTPERISQLMCPAFQDIILGYQSLGEVHEATGLTKLELVRRMTVDNLVQATMMEADVIHEIKQSESVLDHAHKIFRIKDSAADRVGFSKQAVNINVNGDFASQLERAVRESDRAKVIDLQPVPESASAPCPKARVEDGGGGERSGLPPPTKFIRRV